MSKLSSSIGVLATDDKLYYVILNEPPDVIESKAVTKANELIKRIETMEKQRKKLASINKLIKKVKDDPKGNPVNAWFIAELQTITEDES